MPDIDIDPRDLPCDILRLLDEAFTLRDSISFEQGNMWTKEASDAYCRKLEDVEQQIVAEFDKPIPDIADMLWRWQTDKTIRFVIFSNKDTANV